MTRGLYNLLLQNIMISYLMCFPPSFMGHWNRKRPGFLMLHNVWVIRYDYYSDTIHFRFWVTIIFSILYMWSIIFIAFTEHFIRFRYTVLSFGSEFASSSEVNSKNWLCTSEVHTLNQFLADKSIRLSIESMAFMMVYRKWPGTVITIVQVTDMHDANSKNVDYQGSADLPRSS